MDDEPFPIEPPATTWRLPDPRAFGSGTSSEADFESHDLVALGGDLEPGTVLAAYRLGLFPMHVLLPMPLQTFPEHANDTAEGHLGWWSPDPRGVLELTDLHVSRSLRQATRKFRCTVNQNFDGVVAGCADRHPENSWINDDIRNAYEQLHELGWAHSVEVWRGDELVGGLYGIAIGGLFAGESMFHRTRDASKVALVHLVSLLVDAGDADQRLFDVQWLTGHLASLGASELARDEYLQRLDLALRTPFPPQLWSVGDQ